MKYFHVACVWFGWNGIKDYEKILWRKKKDYEKILWRKKKEELDTFETFAPAKMSTV